MKIPFRKASTLSKAEGSKLGWRERLAALKGKGKQHKSTAKLEIDDANGEKLIFPEIGDISEIAEGVAIEATDGEHVFIADTKTYTVTVAGGKVTAVVETVIEEAAADTEMNAETVAFVEAVAEALEAGETFQTTAKASIEKLTTDLATALGEIKTLKSTMSHAKPKEGEAGEAKEFKVGGKKIDLSKINLK